MPLFPSMFARLRGVSIGSNCLIEDGVRFRQPKRIVVGDGVEIRRNCILDARTQRQRGIEIGSSTKLKDGVAILCYLGHCTIGERCIVQRHCTLFCHGGVAISDDVLIGPNVVFAGAEYALRDGELPFNRQGYVARPIEVGSNVYIGAGAVVASGARIASNIVVGANSYVSGVLDRPGLYSGAPAEFRRPLIEASGDDEFLLPTWGR